MKNLILFITLLVTCLVHSQKGTFTIGGGGSLMVSGISNKEILTVNGFPCCVNEGYEDPSHSLYQPNYEKTFLMFSNSDVDIVPYLELSYYPIDRFKLMLNTFGFKRTTKFSASRYYGPTTSTQSYSISYHEESLRFGVGIGVSYEILNFNDKQSLSFGILSSFDKILQRAIIKDHGFFKSSPGADQQEIKASEVYQPYNRVNYFLFSLLSYEYKFTKQIAATAKFRYNPNTKFTRNYRITIPRRIYSSILAFDLQLVYRFVGK